MKIDDLQINILKQNLQYIYKQIQNNKKQLQSMNNQLGKQIINQQIFYLQNNAKQIENILKNNEI